MIIQTYLFLLALASAPVGGLWLPTTGTAGENAHDVIGGGGDGALYAAGLGMVYRLEPGAEWTRIGRYAPRVRWTAEGVKALGSFPLEMISAVEVEADEALEADLGELSFDNLPTVLIGESLSDFVQQSSRRSDSPFHVSDLTRALRGVWLTTGYGLFHATKEGLEGPIKSVRGPINASLDEPDGLLLATNEGLFRLSLGRPAQLLRVGRIDGLTRAGDFIVYVSEGQLFAGKTIETAIPLPGPLKRAEVITGDRSGLYAATALAVYRRVEGQWTLCARLPEAPIRLVAAEGLLHAVTPTSVYLYDETCGTVTGTPGPWPTGFEFTDVTRLGGFVWAASGAGAFMLGPLDADTAMQVQMEGFERAVRAIPSPDVLVLRALENNQLAAPDDFRWRYLLAFALPSVALKLNLGDARFETFNHTADSRETAIGDVRPTWTVGLVWKVPLDRVFNVGVSGGVEFETEYDNLLEDVYTSDGGELVTEVSDLETSDELVVEGGLSEFLDTGGDDFFASPDDFQYLAADRAASQKRQLSKSRDRLVIDIRRLYQQRQNLLYRLWVLRSKNLQQRATLLLSVDETEAQLAALTGESFRTLAPKEALKESPK